jgi:hypothetical protein
VVPGTVTRPVGSEDAASGGGGGGIDGVVVAAGGVRVPVDGVVEHDKVTVGGVGGTTTAANAGPSATTAVAVEADIHRPAAGPM